MAFDSIIIECSLESASYGTTPLAVPTQTSFGIRSTFWTPAVNISQRTSSKRSASSKRSHAMKSILWLLCATSPTSTSCRAWTKRTTRRARWSTEMSTFSWEIACGGMTRVASWRTKWEKYGSSRVRSTSMNANKRYSTTHASKTTSPISSTPDFTNLYD